MTAPVAERPSRARRLGRPLLFAGLLLVAFSAVYRWRQARVEPPAASPAAALVADVDTLRIAELTWRDVTDAYLPCGSEAEARAAIDAGAPSRPACLETLGFRPPDAGTAFWVTVTDGGFEAHGVARHDGDVLHAVATESQPAALRP